MDSSLTLVWQTLENSSRIFSQKFQFPRAWHGPISGKLIHQNFKSTSIYKISFCKILIFDWLLCFGGVFQKSNCVMPPNSKIDDWMSFPEFGLAMPRMWKKLNRFSWILVGWVFHKSVWLIPRNLPLKDWTGSVRGFGTEHFALKST